MKTPMRWIIPILLCAVAYGVGVFLAGRISERPVLTLRADPGGAVFVDGEYRGRAEPELVLDDLAPGEHLLRISTDGFQPERRTVRLQADETVEIALRPIPSGTLSVVSHPAGAAVVLDGHLRGRTPLRLEQIPAGRHSLEITGTNYLVHTETIRIEAGETAEVNARLRHRQVQTLRARIQSTPSDISAYNDLGELLFVLGRYDEAAEVYADGMVATGKYGSKDPTNRRNMQKMKREARKKHNDPEGLFHKALDEAILKTVKTGAISPILYEEFRAIRRSRFGDDYYAAFEGLVKAHPNSRSYIYNLLELYRKDRKYDRLADLVARILDTTDRLGLSDRIRLAQTLHKAWNGAVPAQKPAILKALGQVLGGKEVSGKKQKSLPPDLLYEIAWHAGQTGKPDIYRETLAAAIKGQKKVRIANRWRIELARLFMDAKDFDRAAGVLQAIIKTNLRGDPSFYRAKRIFKDIRSKITPKPDPK